MRMRGLSHGEHSIRHEDSGHRMEVRVEFERPGWAVRYRVEGLLGSMKNVRVPREGPLVLFVWVRAWRHKTRS